MAVVSTLLGLTTGVLSRSPGTGAAGYLSHKKKEKKRKKNKKKKKKKKKQAKRKREKPTQKKTKKKRKKKKKRNNPKTKLEEKNEERDSRCSVPGRPAQHPRREAEQMLKPPPWETAYHAAGLRSGFGPTGKKFHAIGVRYHVQPNRPPKEMETMRRNWERALEAIKSLGTARNKYVLDFFTVLRQYFPDR